MRSLALFRVLPLVIASAIPFGLVSCSSEEADDTSAGGTSSGATGGTGGSSGSGTGGSTSGSAGQATGGTNATGGTGGSTGGSGGTGGSTAGMGAGGAGASAGGTAGRGTAGAGGMGGTGVAGSGQGGAATGGAATGGASSGGMSAGGASSGGASSGGASSGGMAGSTSGGTFTLTSPNHMDGAKFDPKYTCAAMDGQFGAGDIPELDWANVPAGTKSFAITFIDTTIGEDMQMGQHWAIWNIPASVMKIAEGMTMLSGDLASAKQARTYLAPCAVSVKNGMDDQYAFTIYALSTDTLTISGTSVDSAVKALKASTSTILGTAKLTGHAGVNGG